MQQYLTVRRLVVTAGVVGVAACSRTMASTSASGVLSAVLATNPALTSSDVAMLAGMSRAQQLTHLALGDSMEIAMAQVVLQRTQQSQTTAPNAPFVTIRQFAQRMITDHTQSLQRGHLIAQQEGLTLQPAPADTMGAHLLGIVNALNNNAFGTDFERQYMLSQIQLHEHMLAELEAMRTIVNDEAMRQHVDADIPVVQAHLNSAQRIAAQLGYTTAR